MSAIPEEVLGLRVEVVRSKRRTSALHIVGNELQVRVPNEVKDSSIIEILQQKKSWINKKVIQLKEVHIPKPKEFVNGESFLFLGQNYRLKIQEGYQVGVELSDGYFEYVESNNIVRRNSLIINVQLVTFTSITSDSNVIDVKM